jgi:hypothetical protein
MWVRKSTTSVFFFIFFCQPLSKSYSMPYKGTFQSRLTFKILSKWFASFRPPLNLKTPKNVNQDDSQEKIRFLSLFSFITSSWNVSKWEKTGFFYFILLHFIGVCAVGTESGELWLPFTRKCPFGEEDINDSVQIFGNIFIKIAHSEPRIFHLPTVHSSQKLSIYTRKKYLSSPT